MAAKSFNQMLVRLDTMLRDTDGFTFIDGEKSEALELAYEDPHVFIIDIDKTLTTVASQSTYDIDEAFEDITEVKYDYNSNGYGTTLSDWDFVNSQLIFNPTSLSLAAGKTLWIYGKRKLTRDDQVPTFLQGYILHLAAANTVDMLMADKTQRFLRNDTTLAELQNSKANHMQSAERLRRGLNNRRAVRL